MLLLCHASVIISKLGKGGALYKVLIMLKYVKALEMKNKNDYTKMGKMGMNNNCQ